MANDPGTRNLDYDRDTVEVMRRVLKRDSSCIDVGAHEGKILKQMLAAAPQGRHHAFEPLPQYAARLASAFPMVQVHQFAVAEKSGVADLQFVENAPAYSGLRRRIYDRPDPIVTRLRVSVTTIDQAIGEQPVAFVKLDIEGGEYHALIGASRLISRCRPVIVFEAGEKSTGQYGVSARDLFSLIAGFGYTLSTMRRWLDGGAPYTVETFSQNWSGGPEFYFIAVP